MDHASGRSRGTAFACFWNKDDADKAVHQSELLNREAGLEVRTGPFLLDVPRLINTLAFKGTKEEPVLDAIDPHARPIFIARAVFSVAWSDASCYPRCNT